MSQEHNFKVGDEVYYYNKTKECNRYCVITEVTTSSLGNFQIWGHWHSKGRKSEGRVSTWINPIKTAVYLVNPPSKDSILFAKECTSLFNNQ